MTKHPCAWSLRNVARFSAGVGMGEPLCDGGVGEGDCLETSALCRMDRAPRTCQPKEFGKRGPSLLREGSPCRHLPITPPAGASSCSSWPQVRCGVRAHWTLLPAKGLRPAASFPIRADDLIKSPKEAINVFDFEPVC